MELLDSEVGFNSAVKMGTLVVRLDRFQLKYWVNIKSCLFVGRYARQSFECTPDPNQPRPTDFQKRPTECQGTTTYHWRVWERRPRATRRTRTLPGTRLVRRRQWFVGFKVRSLSEELFKFSYPQGQLYYQKGASRYLKPFGSYSNCDTGFICNKILIILSAIDVNRVFHQHFSTHSRVFSEKKCGFDLESC